MTLKQIDGLPIIDAKGPITLTVNDNDVAKSDRLTPEDCAVVRAVRRQLHAREARVHLGRVYVRSNESNWVRYVTPRPLRTEIIAYDRGGTFAPGTFTLPAPHQRGKQTHGRRQGTLKNQTRQPGSPPKKPRIPPRVVQNVRIGPAG